MINLITTTQISESNKERRNVLLHSPIEDILNQLSIPYKVYKPEECIKNKINGVICITSDLYRLDSNEVFEEKLNSLLTHDVLDCVYRGFAKIILFDASSLRESVAIPHYLIRFKNFLIKKQIKSNQCIFFTNIEIENFFYPIEKWEFFETAIYLLFTREKKELNLDKKLQKYNATKNYRFLVLNAKPRFHRYLLMYNFYKKCNNFDQQFNYSLRDITVPDLHKNLVRYQSNIFEKFIDGRELLQFLPLLKKLPSFIDGEDTITKEITWERTLLQTFYTAGINIVTETTLTFDGRIFLTEKTFRSIMTKMPFIICGQPGVLQKLHEYGYKTFNTFWDESYDTEQCPYERINKITKIVEYLSNLANKDFDNLIKNTKDIVLYNFNHMMNKRAPYTIKKLVNILNLHNGESSILL
jgi:hypothetical protein